MSVNGNDEEYSAFSLNIQEHFVESEGIPGKKNSNTFNNPPYLGTYYIY